MKHKTQNIHSTGHEKGFTLIEIASVLVIVGLALGTLSLYLKIYFNQLRFNQTMERLDKAEEVLYEFYALNGRYPCPADPTLDVDDAEFGMEHCRDVAAAGCVADGVVCINTNTGDPDGDGTNDFIMIGSLPVRTLLEELGGPTPAEGSSFRARDSYDGYAMKYTYAVTERMADPTTNSVLDPANPNLGAVNVVDENNIALTVPQASAQYIVVSHGDNQEGAHTRSGDKMPGCSVFMLDGVTPAAPGPSPSGNATERENCDYDDGIFVKGTRSFLDNDLYYDDLLTFKPSGRAQLWVKVPADVPGQSYIKNTNLGNVGVGIEDPEAKLHVDGDISAEKETYANRYCDVNGDNCFNPEDIAGSTGFKCPAGQIATGINDENNNDHVVLRCQNVFENSPNNQSCPTGEAIQSMTYNYTGTVTLNCVDINP